MVLIVLIISLENFLLKSRFLEVTVLLEIYLKRIWELKTWRDGVLNFRDRFKPL